MKNLFICHTQAHLILASGLALGRFKNDENLLILFVDFGLKDELNERLDKTFTRTLYLQKGMDRYGWTMAIRRFLFRNLLGVGRFYDRDFSEMGGLAPLKRVYACNPEAVREPYRSKKQLVGISDAEYRAGLEAMYPKAQLDVQPNSVILVVDKLDRYAFPDKVRASLGAFIKRCQDEGKTVICKFHPRETEVWDIFEGCTTLDKSVGIESAYVSLSDIKDSITIAGIKSTGLMSAKKLGYHTVSLFPACGEKNDNLMRFYEKLGITLIQ